jgi:hypothetical protein
VIASSVAAVATGGAEAAAGGDDAAVGGVEAAAGGADERDGSGAARPIRVFERSGLDTFGRGVAVAVVSGALASGAVDGRAGDTEGEALGTTDGRTGAIEGEAFGATDAALATATGAAVAGAAGVGAAGAPQSVSMSSVEGGTEGKGVLARGGALEAGRGGMDDVRP